MAEEEFKRARKALGAVPGLNIDADGAKLTRLGGLTNLVYRVESGGAPLCLRLPGAGTEEYIDRGNEAQAVHEVARVGVSPEVIHADPETGVMVTRFIEGTTTMTPDLFNSVPGAPERAGKAFRKLHESDARLNYTFELFKMIDGYLDILSGKDVDLPEGYHDTLRESEAARTALKAHPLPSAACHCDPLCENFLDTGERMWIVDWEYSGMNDPMWDLGDLSVEAGLDDKGDEELLQAYFGGEPSPSDRGRMLIYKAMCDLLWTLWGLIQHANDNPVEDFWEYSTTRFNRCKALMGKEAFAGSIAAVEKG